MLIVLKLTTMSELTHFDADGNARMVDVGDKPVTRRMAKAQGVVRMRLATAEMIKDGAIQKGDVLNVARIAAINGSKWTPHLIPMCHPIAVDSVDIEFAWGQESSTNLAELAVSCTVYSTGRTGVEMEALSAVTIAVLTVYDMCKSVDREMEVTSVCLLEKSGGKSGHFVRQDFPTED